MTTTAERTARLLELMTKGDDLFNARDFDALDTVHHPDMIAYVTGSAEPIYGRQAHAAAMQQLVRMFPDIRVHTPYPIQFGTGDWITVVTNVTGTFTGEMVLPDGTLIAPTGKTFDVEFGQTSKWDGEQLVVISAFWDAELQAKQLGIAQQSGAWRWSPGCIRPLAFDLCADGLSAPGRNVWRHTPRQTSDSTRRPRPPGGRRVEVAADSTSPVSAKCGDSTGRGGSAAHVMVCRSRAAPHRVFPYTATSAAAMYRPSSARVRIPSLR
jgi:hypothetical protein